MRVLLVCTALCAVSPAPLHAFSLEAKTEQANTDLLPAKTAFAYAARHDVAAMPDTVIEALRPGEDVSIHREDTEPSLFPIERQVPRALTRNELCNTVASVAAANDIPVPFLANLIQQESAFKVHAVSPVGAQGIAQFMPRTARAYGLHNPFDPVHAISVSGQFLRELIGQFGNLGLAAAAYNAGPGRVLNWVQNRGKLPEETQNYVKSITGRAAMQWARPKKDEEIKLPPHARCPGLLLQEADAVAMREPIVRIALADPAEKTKIVFRKGKKIMIAVASDKGKPATVKLTPSNGGLKVAVAKNAPAAGKAVAAKAGGAKIVLASAESRPVKLSKASNKPEAKATSRSNEKAAARKTEKPTKVAAAKPARPAPETGKRVKVAVVR